MKTILLSVASVFLLTTAVALVCVLHRGDETTTTLSSSSSLLRHRHDAQQPDGVSVGAAVERELLTSPYTDCLNVTLQCDGNPSTIDVFESCNDLGKLPPYECTMDPYSVTFKITGCRCNERFRYTMDENGTIAGQCVSWPAGPWVGSCTQVAPSMTSTDGNYTVVIADDAGKVLTSMSNVGLYDLVSVRTVDGSDLPTTINVFIYDATVDVMSTALQVITLNTTCAFGGDMILDAYSGSIHVWGIENTGQGSLTVPGRAEYYANEDERLIKIVIGVDGTNPAQDVYLWELMLQENATLLPATTTTTTSRSSESGSMTMEITDMWKSEMADKSDSGGTFDGVARVGNDNTLNYFLTVDSTGGTEYSFLLSGLVSNGDNMLCRDDDTLVIVPKGEPL